MNQRDFLNMARGYIAGKSISNNINSNLRNLSEKYARMNAAYSSLKTLSTEVGRLMLEGDEESALKYLNSHFSTEIIFDAQNQKDQIYSLETLIKMRKAKYLPLYERIGKEMPESLRDMTADGLCEMLGIENLHIIDSLDGKSSPSHTKEGWGWKEFFAVLAWVFFLGVIILISLL